MTVSWTAELFRLGVVNPNYQRSESSPFFLLIQFRFSFPVTQLRVDRVPVGAAAPPAAGPTGGAGGGTRTAGLWTGASTNYNPPSPSTFPKFPQIPDENVVQKHFPGQL